MDTIILHSVVKVESAPPALPSAPERALHRLYPDASGSEPGPSIELSPLRRPATSVPDKLPESGFSSIVATPADETTRFDLERSQPECATPPDAVEVETVQSMTQPYMNRFRLATVCVMNFTNGLNDSAPGALLPYMEKYYSVGYAIVSLIFVGNAVGFITGALFLDSLRHRLGRARALAASQLLMLSGYVCLVCAPPFPVVVVAFFLLGFGMSINLAIGNTFCGSLNRATMCLGWMHGSYGLGGTLGPLIATAIVTLTDGGTGPWNHYYFLTLGLALFNGCFGTWSFWSYERELGPTHPLVVRDAAGAAGNATHSVRNQLKTMATAFSSPVVVLGSLFIFAYQGAEVSISGWVISFLITARHGAPDKVGYVTSGFWGAIMLGRIALSAPAHRIGERYFVYAMTVGAAVFELLVWLVPNVIGDAVAVTVVGLLLGPVYPCAAAVLMGTMSRKEQFSGMGVISAFGSSGGAAAPFTTGILAQAAGTFVLHPIAIGLFAVMIVCWYFVPHKPKRTE